MTAQKWVGITVAGMAGLVILVGVSRGQTPNTGTPLAATVNGDPISLGEVEAVIKLLPPPPSTPTELQKKQMQREALELLMDDALMRQFLNKNGRQVAASEIDKQIRDLEIALKAQNKTFKDFLNETVQTEAHFRQDIIKKIQWDDYTSQYMSEGNLRKYYVENQDFYDKVTVRASHVLIRMAPNASESDVRAARVKLQDLRQRMAAGQIDFAEAAKKFSQCASGPQGGDIGFFPRKFAVDEQIAKTAFGLKVGEVSDVVRSEYGLHLIKVTDRKKGQTSTYETMKDEVVENIKMDLWQTKLAQQRAAAKIEIHMP